ncbi:Cytochrome P450 Cyp6b29 [Operophtera brumata]|uniref:unspecific monooxygenase n=1 Tax=Operophtera brumata TaxID=104452 RepID=A0A0L7KSZ7_OPEBR|nr:Cytochrome P450 Cyp6b29 [Operophtera brumata]
MVIIYLLIAFATLAYALYLYFTRTFNHWKSRGIIGPEPFPFFGNLKETALRRKNITDVFRKFYDEFPNEKVVGIYRMTTPSLVLHDLDVIKNVLIKDFDVFLDRGVEFSKEGLGSNLFHSDGDTWRVLRNRFTPQFTSGKLKNMLHLMTERGESFLEYVGKVCDQQPDHEVQQLVQKFAMSTISACAYGLDIDTIHDKIDVLRRMDELMFNSTYFEKLDMLYPGILKKINESLFPAFVTNFFYDLVNKVITERNGVAGNRNDFMDLILEIRQQTFVTNFFYDLVNKVITERNGVAGNRNDFMDLILEIRQQSEVYGTTRNVDDKAYGWCYRCASLRFYAAGYETSAVTMCFLLYELAKNPDIQEKLHAEIIEVLKRHEGKMTYETLQDMTYMGKVFDETLCMYPIVEPLLRSAMIDYKVPGTDIVIEKGTMALVSISGIHYDAKYYPDPKKFDPVRFSAENSRDRHSCAYMPFGIGPRNFVGMWFAKVQSQVCISKLLSKFRVEMSKNTPAQVEMDPKRNLMGPNGGIPLRIVKR